MIITTPDTDKKWYVLYTNPRAEKKVATSLANAGYTVYLPLQTTIKQWSDRKKKVEEPLFKSYLFVYINYDREHIPVLQIQGIMKFIRIGKELTTLRQQQIDAIQLLLATGSDIEVSDVTYDIGAEVEIYAGPLKGLKGHVVKQLGSRNFSISLEQLGASLLVTVPINFLRQT